MATFNYKRFERWEGEPLEGNRKGHVKLEKNNSAMGLKNLLLKLLDIIYFYCKYKDFLTLRYRTSTLPSTVMLIQTVTSIIDLLIKFLK